MTLIATRPTTPIVPPASLTEMFRATLLSECQATIERVCNEAMSAIEAACGVIPAAKAEVPEAEVIPAEPRKHPCSEKKLHAFGEMNDKRKLSFIIPRMMMLDMDFGGTLTSDSVCERFRISRKLYHRVKKNVLAIKRLHKNFGGKMNSVQTAEIAQLHEVTVCNYLKIMKEGFNAGDK